MAKRSSSAPVKDEPAASAVTEATPPAVDNNPPSKGPPPVWKRRLYGNGSFVECAVFRHDAEAGQQSFPNFSVVLDRSYKDDKGDWKATRSLRREDLLVAAHILQRAYAWITEQEQS